ncbi:Response regulator MprA [Gemmata obscuriglobus]|uniref:Response regulator n=1 Tax=Gemmata obscuriglobus TaxID=114 RepID=A0A2Z3GYF3_9BACT|nr:response regulator [Gemmata obscuriglobus]AWM38468.1 response regulator [Gemmata obscuriglobus]QEG28598.1 Response regulator MprA [Gemmata obscuriglobus]VTS06750.1 pas sensor protein : PAS sensor protein OS=Nitrosococcus halophilus (strain Nc4) GN=Nhal_1977 PE=4 SV=1: Response_reg [Gemmata obscuriglobus UQM 2246]
MRTESDLLSTMRGGTPYAGLRGLRILIVDDNRDGANSLCDLLAICGGVVHVRYSGRAAMEAIASLAPQVVILDLSLPDMNGCEVAAEVRAADRSGGPALIALTGHADDKTRERVAQCGFDMQFIKPVDPGELLHAIGSMAGQGGLVAGPTEPRSVCSQSEPTAEPGGTG